MSRIGLLDVDGHNFPNLALMKISSFYKSQRCDVEFVDYLSHYDKAYVSKVFGNEYSNMNDTVINADEVNYGGTGFAIKIKNKKEVYYSELDLLLPEEIENCYPDYSLYPELTKNKAYGFLSRGCCNNCDFCIVSKKEGMCSHKVSNLDYFWNGQKEIVLLDPNLLACKDRKELLQQLIDSKATIDFTQGLDARFITEENALLLKQIKVKMWRFAFDFVKNEKQIMMGLKIFKDIVNPNIRNAGVYVLTNYNTSFEEDYRRIKLIQEIGLTPDVRIYRKVIAPKITRDLQRWCNNRIIYRSVPDFMDYIPRKDGKTIKQLYFSESGKAEKWN